MNLILLLVLALAAGGDGGGFTGATRDRTATINLRTGMIVDENLTLPDHLTGISRGDLPFELPQMPNVALPPLGWDHHYGNGNFAPVTLAWSWTGTPIAASWPALRAPSSAFLELRSKAGILVPKRPGNGLALKGSTCPTALSPAIPNRRVASWSCSMGLIARNRIITAAHCLREYTVDVPTTVDVTTMEVAFGYVDAPSAATVKKRALKRIVHCDYGPHSDIAVVELAEPLPTDTPVFERHAAPLSVGVAVHLASHPSGYPLLISTCLRGPDDCVQALVTIMDDDWFRAPIDSARGSSGGIVFDDNFGLVGIFSGGKQHLGSNSVNGCAVNEQYGDRCYGDWVARVDGLDAALFDPDAVLPDATCDFSNPPKLEAGCLEARIASP